MTDMFVLYGTGAKMILAHFGPIIDCSGHKEEISPNEQPCTIGASRPSDTKAFLPNLTPTS